MAFIDIDKITSAERLFLDQALIMCYFTADNEKDEEEYYFLALPGERMDALNILLAQPEILLDKIRELGHIVASGPAPPTEEVKDWLVKHYSINSKLLEPAEELSD